uniref:Breast cancer metastasis-suppressor 1-like protein-A n=1 Tax=Gouania willdenowi TaxID=441366 RepID=A0A8C5DRM1_GOUWI
RSRSQNEGNEDCERRRMECLDEMSNLEKQFNDLRDQLYRERLSQVNSKLSEVEAGRASEYLEPLAVLLENIIDITSGNNQASRACTTYSSWICVA